MAEYWFNDLVWVRNIKTSAGPVTYKGKIVALGKNQTYAVRLDIGPMMTGIPQADLSPRQWYEESEPNEKKSKTGF